jgi:hypothetical protein
MWLWSEGHWVHAYSRLLHSHWRLHTHAGHGLSVGMPHADHIPVHAGFVLLTNSHTGHELASGRTLAARDPRPPPTHTHIHTHAHTHTHIHTHIHTRHSVSLTAQEDKGREVLERGDSARRLDSLRSPNASDKSEAAEMLFERQQRRSESQVCLCLALSETRRARDSVGLAQRYQRHEEREIVLVWHRHIKRKERYF